MVILLCLGPQSLQAMPKNRDSPSDTKAENDYDNGKSRMLKQTRAKGLTVAELYELFPTVSMHDKARARS